MIQISVKAALLWSVLFGLASGFAGAAYRDWRYEPPYCVVEGGGGQATITCYEGR